MKTILFSMIAILTLVCAIPESAPIKKKCSGYTVVDNTHVKWCDGQIIRYEWQPKPLTAAQIKLVEGL